jgi:peptide/nickel transport system substrate-binding protein
MSKDAAEEKLYNEVVSGRLSRRELFKRAATLGLSVATANWLASCAPAAQAPAATSAPAAQQQPAATAAPAGPKPGGVSTWAAETDPVALNPITNSNFSSTQGFEHCYESLTGFDSKLNVVPALAESWTTPDDTTYIFKLRQGVKFHDGSEFSAEDVKYTFDIVLDPKGPAIWRGNFDQVDKVEVMDKNTVKFTTKTPFPPLLGAFAILRSSAILKKGAMENSKLETQVNGTGPYKLVEYVPKSQVKLARNADYWGKPLPYINEVTFKILEEEEARIAGLRAKTIDYAFLTADGGTRLKEEKGLTIARGPRAYLYAFVVNRKRKPWDDKRVRQAVSLATDRQEIIDKVFSGQATMSGPVAYGFGDWFIPDADLKAKWYKTDLDKAKALLKEAGVPQGQELDLLMTAFNQNFAGLAVVFKDQMAKIGINVKIRTVEQGVFIKEAAQDVWNYDMNGNAYTARHDPDGYVYNGLYSKSPTAVGYANTQFDDLIVKGRTTINRDERKKLYRQAQEILLDDAPNIWLCNDTVTEGIQTYLKGYTQSFYTYRSWGLKNAWLDKGS